MNFDHERLDCYRLAAEVARWLRGRTFPRGDGPLRKQAVRAADSVVLNIAEGASRRGDAAKNHFEIALGSAGEVSAVLDLVALDGAAANQEKLRRVGAMLAVLRQ